MMVRLANIAGPCLKKFKIYFLFFFAFLLVTLGSGFLWWQWSILPLTNNQSATTNIFVIKKGEGFFQIANNLKKEGLIRSPLAFKILVFYQGLGNKIQAGNFRLSPLMSAEEIAKTLIHGTLDVRLTFPEGWRREEFTQRLEKNLDNFDSRQFLALTSDLEGKLFPDTYLIPKNASPSGIVKILTENFNKKTGEFNLSRSQLILASIVEREARLKEDRPVVAGILLKRWQNNWPLQTDATIQYAIANPKIDDWWPQIEKNDLEIKSAYNTYKFKGLPPMPICNPGLDSIKAVISPQATDYWFYLSSPTGKIYYAKTIEEHQQNIVQYLKRD